MAEVDFAQIFNALPSPMMVLDTELRYVAANSAYLATTGRTHVDQLRGHKVMELFPNPGESGTKLVSSIKTVIASGQPDTLAYLHYPIAGADGQIENRYWTAVHVPILDADGSVNFVLQNTVDVTEFVRMREAATLPFQSLSTATRLLERTREVEAASADFRRMFQQAPAFFAVLSGPQHTFTFASDSYTRLVGGRNVIGYTVRDALPEVVEQGFVDLLDRVFTEGYSHQAEGASIMLVNANGDLEESFLDFSYNPIRDGEGTITGVFVQGMDRTEAVRAAHRQRLLIDELNHRVKNTLAAVQSIASQSLRNNADPIAARDAFQARIQALSKAHNLLSDRQWYDTEIGTLITQELEAFRDDQVEASGPRLMVNAKATVALAMVLHELASNAARHGALSNDQGRLEVRWSVADDNALQIDWTERGGPPTEQPSPGGFGSRLSRTVVMGELAGSFDTSYDPQGFSARLIIPAAAYTVREEFLV